MPNRYPEILGILIFMKNKTTEVIRLMHSYQPYPSSPNNNRTEHSEKEDILSRTALLTAYIEEMEASLKRLKRLNHL